MKVSLLDRSRTRAGHDGSALRHSIDRAVAAERLGYERFWVAEHHAVPGISSGAPAVLLAAIGAQTQSIRLGSAGVMLPHHQPLVVAEQFQMLEELHPGRIDLGLGRTLGFTDPVRRALRQDSAEPEDFEADLRELREFLNGMAAVTARPRTMGAVPMFLLATGQGVALAARLGLPLILGGPVVHSPELSERLAAYRQSFRPAARGEQPRVLLSLDVFLAESEERGRELALPEAWAMARAREMGEFGPLEPVGSIQRQSSSEQTRRRVDQILSRTLAGPETVVRPRLEHLVEITGAEEIVLSTSTFDLDELAGLDVRAIEFLADLSPRTSRPRAP